MKRTLLCLLLVCLLTGCTAVPSSTRPTTPLVPNLQPPVQTLTQAVEKTAGATSFLLTYGSDTADSSYAEHYRALLTKDGKGGYLARCDQSCGCAMYVSGCTALRRACDTGEVTVHTADVPYGLDFILRDLPQGAVTAGLVDRFCTLSFTASPSNTGFTYYEVWDLPYTETCLLLTGKEPAGEAAADFLGFFSMELNVGGYLTGVAFSDLDGKTEHRYAVTRLNNKFTVGPPDWTGLT